MWSETESSNGISSGSATKKLLGLMGVCIINLWQYGAFHGALNQPFLGGISSIKQRFWIPPCKETPILSMEHVKGCLHLIDWTSEPPNHYP